jgi:Putative adhesin
MPHVARTIALVMIVATAASAQEVVGRLDEVWTAREPLSSGERLHLATPNGAITITQGSGREVLIRGEKRADSGGSLDEIGFRVVRSGNGLTVCAVFEDDDECTMEAGYGTARDARGGRRYHRARANFVVQIPAGVHVQLETGNGAVSISGAGADVRATTGNGRVNIARTDGRVYARTGNGAVAVDEARGEVDVSTGNGDVRVATAHGPVNARSGNGDIDVSMDRVDGGVPMTFSTGSGRIVVAVPEGFGAELDSRTGNGNFESDVPLRIEGRIDRQHIRGTLGDGGERLTLATGNGDIRIRSRR